MKSTFKQKSTLAKYKELVEMKYQLYNGLFLNLPFERINDMGVNIPIFSHYAKNLLIKKVSPQKIVKRYFNEIKKVKEEKKQNDILFSFLQFVERQVVLFDALEESAFSEIKYLNGPGSIFYLQSLVKESSKEEELKKILKNYKVRIVLTAHPTQFYPGVVLSIITDLAKAIQDNDLSEINKLLLQMGKTPFRYKQKPTPIDEANSLIWYLENIFYQVLPNIHQKLWSIFDFNEEYQQNHLPIVDLGFWPGGDRDGNPFVTAEVTTKVARDLKKAVIRCYLKDINALRRRLSFEDVYDSMSNIKKRLTQTYENNLSSQRHSNDTYSSAEELLIALREVRSVLIQKHSSLFLEELDNVIYKINNFGFYFASLDLRQNSSVHLQVIKDIFKQIPQFSQNLDKEEKKQMVEFDLIEKKQRLLLLDKILSNNISFPRIANILPEGIAKETIMSFQVAKNIQQENGEKGLHRYIISNTQCAADIIIIFLLARLAGWKLSNLKFDIIPLFETIDDLENAQQIMAELYAHPLYKKHLKSMNNEQTVMLGFSDGTKDGGCVTANWSIYKAKEHLTQLSRHTGILVNFFDGRGGPPARGGGNTHKFYRAQGNSIEQKELQLTIQGQTISSKFGSIPQAQFNVETFVTAGLENKLFPEWEEKLSLEQVDLIESISQSSLKTYTDFKKHPLFLPYLKNKTPLRYFSELNIASRPVKRKNEKEFIFEDLRAIPFVGAWSQMKQNIPGYYGLGGGLQKMIDQGKLKDLKILYKKSMFFRTLVENSMQSLKKTFIPLTQYLENDRKFKPFWRLIKEEKERTTEILLKITNQEDLLDTDPVVRESIKLREQVVFPLLVIEQFAFIMADKLDAENKDNSIYQKMVIKSIAANINASRNSA